MSNSEFTPQQHFEYLEAEWIRHFVETRDYLRSLDGETSRAIGCIVRDLIEAKDKGEKVDWWSVEAAEFLRRDTVLWHELSDSRKK